MDKKTTTNEKIAANFLNFYYRTEGDRRHKLQTLSAKFNLTDDAALEDEFIMTLMKCYNRILSVGFEFKKGKKDEKDFGAYFDTALNMNLLKYIERLKSLVKKQTTVLNFNHPYFQLVGNIDCTAPPEFDFDEEVVDKKQAYEDLVLEAMSSLPEKYSEVIYMKVDGMKYHQMERILGLTNGMVKSRLVTARKMVKAYIESKLKGETIAPLSDEDTAR